MVVMGVVGRVGGRGGGGGACMAWQWRVRNGTVAVAGGRQACMLVAGVATKPLGMMPSLVPMPCWAVWVGQPLASRCRPVV